MVLLLGVPPNKVDGGGKIEERSLDGQYLTTQQQHFELADQRVARIQRDCLCRGSCTSSTTEQNPSRSHRKMVALELDTNDGHDTIQSEPAPKKDKRGLTLVSQSLNPDHLFDL